MRSSKAQPQSIATLLLFSLSLFVPRICTAGGPETFAQALTRHHIALTEPALVEALRNPEKEVRGLAAWQLLEMKAADALPEILEAARVEQDPQTRVSLAGAAAYFGAKEANATLLQACHDSAAQGAVRITAARYLLDNQDRACMPDLLALITAENERDTRINAFYLVAQRSDLTGTEAARVFSAALEALREADSIMRLHAAEILSFLHSPDAIPYLKTAIQVEPEDALRPQMQTVLDGLLHPKPAQ